jgi:hypothetical protein
MTRTWKVWGVAALALPFPAPLASQVRVVNVIPFSQSGEASPDPEPTISVNPANPREIAIASLTWAEDVCESKRSAPVFLSASGGDRWALACIIPLDSVNASAGDYTVRFAHDGVLHLAMLFPLLPPPTMRILSSPQPVGRGPAMLRERFVTDSFDQPWMALARRGPVTYVLVGGNDKTLIADTTALGTGVVFVSAGDTTSGRRFVRQQLERRMLRGQNYAVRVAAHEDGTVYAVYYSPLAANPGGAQDVTVARDDSLGLGSPAFGALREPVVRDASACRERDGKPGFRVARCRQVPFEDGVEPTFGQERRVSANLSVAIDPRTSRTVYVAWADSVDRHHYTLHVRRSTDGGTSWSEDLYTVPDATNPALAVDSVGAVGFMYQQLEGTGNATRWVTRLLLTDDAFATTRSFSLADTPAGEPVALITPYIGDYVDLVARGETFYGAFSASNKPDSAHFPNGVVFLRRADFTTKDLLNTGARVTVPVSIDPYFVRAGKADHPECPEILVRLNTGAATARDRDLARARQIGCRLPAERPAR